ncbi:hypothetical protein HYE68_010784 [Fusarium pseudograminearum]|nr:hypothetical protein HYE68_010784 [Fusarium pseudograminearum]
MQRAISHNTTVFIDCSDITDSLAAAFIASIPAICRTYRLGSGLASTALEVSKITTATLLGQCLEVAVMAGGLSRSFYLLVGSSRRPQLPEAALHEAHRLGATVKVMPMDLTDKESVKAAVAEIDESMSKFANVFNAAMVLQDGFFIDVDTDQLNNTLAAKVLSTHNTYLDSIFHETELDFFSCLGSVASGIGNVGQSNYHAANFFMDSLINQRRTRGLAASIIHIAYVTDERDRQLDSHLRKVRLMPTSETDMHHAFTEAIRGGKPDSITESHDIIMGIEPLTEPVSLDQQPRWMDDPRFGHFAPLTSVHFQ